MTTMSADDVVDVILRDGSTLRLRPCRVSDADALLEFYTRLSSRTLYLRFHGFPSVGPALVTPWLDPDWVERGALVATLEDRIVALGSYVRLREPGTAEAAFVVDDAMQGKGLGTRLLEQLAARAGAVGIESFVAEVVAENAPMLAVFAGAGFEITRELASGVVEVRFPIASTASYTAHVDERDHVAVISSLQPFFAPHSVAVLGASSRRGSIGGELFRNILAQDYAGAAYPVNRNAEPVGGVRSYATVEDIPDTVELAVICLPGKDVLSAAEACLQHGIRALCVISAGFAEIGPEGVERQAQLLELVRAHGARLIGPNCLGIAVAGPRLNATFARGRVPFGNIAFSSQSGALGLAVIEAAGARGLGVSSFVSIGNKADVSSNDLLEYWEDDSETALILLYLESFGNPRKFGRVARRVARKKPILALKSGHTGAGARAASSHTAALAGSEAAVDALFRQAGVMRAATLEELLDVATLLARQPLPTGRRVAVLTNAGGLGILCADACEAAGLELPALGDATVAALQGLLPAEASTANPVDMLGSATAATYEAVMPLLLADRRVDAVIVLFVPPVVAGATEVAAGISRAVAASHTKKPVLASLISGDEIAVSVDGAVLFAYPESAARALGRAAERAEWLRRPSGSVPVLENIDLNAARKVIEEVLAQSDDAWLEADQIDRLLAAYGVRLVPERVAATPEEAVEAAAALGFPAVVKTAEPGAHKTERGGVALDLADADAVRAAADEIGGPVVVQPMVVGGAELLAGIVQDPMFGPLVGFGPGGVLAELIGGAAFRIAPLTDADAEDLVHGGKAGKLTAGFRGKPASDAHALADLLLRLSRLGEDLPEVAELDLNPVVGLPSGYVVVDARVRVRRLQPAHRIKTW